MRLVFLFCLSILSFNVASVMAMDGQIPENSSEAEIRNLLGKRLIRATLARNQEKVLTLLNQGADINYPSSLGLTPLHWAASNNWVEGTSLLISRNADVNPVNRWGNTPLMMSILKGTATVSLLISADADVNVINREGKTALWIASSERLSKMVQLLLKQDAVLGPAQLSREAMNFLENEKQKQELENCLGQGTVKDAQPIPHELIQLISSFKS